jgi:serine/threonine-protein kinase PknG
VHVPPTPDRDPASAVLANPQVSESKRFCGSCGRPVGRGRDGRLALAEGYCRHCGHPFSFVPKLTAGELVAGQYEVLGCLAHGGLGWIYLAKDRNVSDRWVVLKGLLDSGDADAMAAAVAERQFLAQVEYPSIVRIYNFVQHADRSTGTAAGYIVMEYAGGQSLREILLPYRRAGQALPLPIALAYAIEVLPALGYLHSRGLVYCDFKPDNVIQTQEQLKLIDMGGVRRIDDDDSPIYGTEGYQAPEIADDGPTPSSDLYTVGRALAVLSFPFSGYQTTFRHSLPPPDTVPLLADQESFYRLLRRATHRDPGQRFQTAADMIEQLTGVLREVVAVADGDPRPAFSTLFSPELQVPGAAAALEIDGARPPDAVPPAAEVVAGLPVPQVDNADAAAGYLATLSTLEPEQRVAALATAVAGEQGTPPEVSQSAETRLALARALIVTGELDRAAAVLDELAGSDPADWRVTWYQGLRELAAGQADAARRSFDAVCDVLPGEPAAKLALALAAEAAGDPSSAARYFQLVWTVDRSFVGAAFGLARTRLRTGDRPAAVAAVAAVPETSSHYIAAQIAAVRIHLTRREPATASRNGASPNGAAPHETAPPGTSPAAGRQSGTGTSPAAGNQNGTGQAAADPAAAGPGAPGPAAPAALDAPDLDELRQAGDRLSRLSLDAGRQQRLTADILHAALDCAAARQPGTAGRLLGCELNERALRTGLERSYRALARLARDQARRIELVDMANEVRPRTFS